MRATRRTIRTAAIATGAIAAFALPAGAAFAADSTPGPVDQGQGQGQEGQKPADEQKPKDDEQKPKDDERKPQELRSFVKSVKLADGSVAKVYKLGQNHYEAEIWANGGKLDTLVANGSKAVGENNGLHVVLNPDGTVTSWVDGGQKKDDGKKPEKEKQEKREKKAESKVVSSVKVTMPDGRVAKLIKTTDGPRVEISLPNGRVLGSIDLKNPSTLNDGWTYKIVDAGKGFYKFVVIDGKHGGDSWVYDFHGKLIEKYTVDGKGGKKTVAPTTGVVPKGGVKAGAEGVGGGSSGNQAPLIAAGGGMAAAGAAGLGFALYHRRGQQR